MKIPDNYHQVESSIQGITIYAPVIQKQGPKLPITYTCPNCGASTSYDVISGGLACNYCGFIKPSDDTTIGLEAEEFEFDLETWRNAEKGWGIIRKELFCTQCGGVISLPSAKKKSANGSISTR